MKRKITYFVRQLRRPWQAFLFALLFVAAIFLGVLLFFQDTAGSEVAEFIPVSLHSVLEADYSIYPNPTPVPGVELAIIWETIRDREPGVTDLESRQAAVENSLLTPVPTVTPALIECQGVHFIYVNRDTWTESAAETALHGYDADLQLGRAGDSLKQIFLYFPINESLPQKTLIHSARLELDVAQTSGFPAMETLFFANLAETFSEPDTSWSNQPQSDFQYSAPVLATGGIHAWDVTEIVQDWLAGRYANNGLVIASQAAEDFLFEYHSRESVSQGAPNGSGITPVGPRLLINCGGMLPQVVALNPHTPTPTATNIPLTPKSERATVTPMPTATLPPTPTLLPTKTLPPTPTLLLPPTTTPVPPPAAPTVSPSPLPPPKNTPALTSLPPTATNPPNTPVPTSSPLPSTATPIPPTATATATSIPPTATFTPTATPVTVDLELTQSDSVDPVIGGNTLTYTLSITNNGPASATNVTVLDALPAGVSLLSATGSQGSGCSGSTTATCDLGSLAVGGSATVTVVVAVPASGAGTLINNVSVSATETELNSGNNTDSETTAIIRRADLSITKSDNPDPVLAGEVLTYTLSITNAGPSDAAGVVVTDTLPAGVVFGSASGGCAHTGGVVTCTVGALASGASGSYTLSVTVNSDEAGPLSNIANVSALTPDSNTSNNSAAEATTVIPIADLSIAKSVDNVTPSEGFTLTYIITATNIGPQNATGVVVSDTLPVGLTYSDYTAALGTTYNNVTGAWTIGALNHGTGVSLTLTATVNAATVNTIITNTASISHADQLDPIPGNNSAEQAVTILPTLAITDVSVIEGNSGTVDAVFTVTLSAISSRVITVSYATANGTATIGGSDYNAGSGTLTFAPGTQVQTITVQVNGDLLEETDEIFFVTLSDPVNANLVDDQGSGTIIDDDDELTTVTSCLVSTRDAFLDEKEVDHNHDDDKEMKVEFKTGQDQHGLVGFNLSSIAPGTNVLTATLYLYQENKRDTVTIHIHRIITDWVESEVTWDSRTAADLWTSPGGDYITVPEIASFTADLEKQYRESDVTAVTQDWVNGTYENYGFLFRAADDDGEVKFRTREEGNEDERPNLCLTYESVQTDLAVDKIVSNAIPLEGQTVVFTVTAGNIGANDATGVVISDTLPAGITYIGSIPTQGSYTPATGVWNVGTVTASTSATLILSATVNAGTAGSTIINTAAITAVNQLDLIPANNADSASLVPVLPRLVGPKPVYSIYLPCILKTEFVSTSAPKTTVTPEDTPASPVPTATTPDPVMDRALHYLYLPVIMRDTLSR